jgi:hypothetical protein
LLGRTATAWQVGVDILRVGEPQLLLEPGIPVDTAVELVALVRKIKGTLTVDPERPLPTGKLSVESTMHVQISHRNGTRSEEMAEDTGTITVTVK